MREVVPTTDEITGARTALIILTYNTASWWERLCAGIRRQDLQPERIIIVDSSSQDETEALAHNAGFDVVRIAQKDFNHGGTRQFALQYAPDAEIVLYLTQDAILASGSSLRHLLTAFADPQVALAYGRQLPRPEARGIEAHARLFNYPMQSEVRTFACRTSRGLKTIFCSNSFAAYRCSALLEVGGFPSNVIFGEDTVTAGKLLQAGYKVAYVADATVYHSHSYTAMQEFRRYFDIGVLHIREPWLQETFGNAEGEGRRFVLSELRYLLRNGPWLIPSAMLHVAAKLLGYRAGRKEAVLSVKLKRQLSMHRGFWN
jgi:rhamnosyltransferase